MNNVAFLFLTLVAIQSVYAELPVSMVPFGETESFITCKVETTTNHYWALIPVSIKKEDDMPDGLVIPPSCLPDTVKLMSFWKKPILNKRLPIKDNDGREVILKWRQDWWGSYVCFYKNNKLMANIRPRRCAAHHDKSRARKIFSIKTISAYQRNYLNDPLYQNFRNASIFQRQTRPWDSFVTDDMSSSSLRDFNKLIAPNQRIPYIGDTTPIANQIRSSELSMTEKYRGRRSTVYYMYRKNIDLNGAKFSYYLFSKSLTPIEGTTNEKIGEHDVNSFRLIDSSDVSEEDEELKKVLICKRIEGIANIGKVSIHEISTSGQCRSSWTVLYEGYTFKETKGETLPYDTFRAVINTRTSFPGDSYVTELTHTDTDKARDGYRHYNTNLIFINADQNALRKYLRNSKVRSNTLNIDWKPVEEATRYGVQIMKRGKPLPGYERPIMTDSTDYAFRFLTADDSYTVKILPYRGNNVLKTSEMEIPLRTAPAAPEINIKKIRSTSIEIDWERDETVERYIVNIVEIPDPSLSGMRDLGGQVESRVFETKPDSWYKISLIGVIDEKNNIQTDEAEEIVHTAPAPPEVYFKALPNGKAKIGFKTFDITGEFHFTITPKLPGVESGTYMSDKEWVVSPPRNTKYQLSLVTDRVSTGFETAMESKQAPDTVELTRVYSLCQWTSKLQKLNCKPKRQGLEHLDGFEWMLNEANGKLITFEEEIAPREVRILHVSGNFFTNLEAVDFLLGKMKNIETLNLSENKISSLSEKLFENTKNLEIVNFAKNEIKEVPDDLFSPIDKTKLKSVSFADNPLSTCGVTRGLIKGLDNLAKLDLHGAGQLKSTSKGVLVGEKIHSNLNIYCRERAR